MSQKAPAVSPWQVVASGLLVFLFGLVSVAAREPAPSEPAFVPGEVLVKFKAQADVQEALRARAGARLPLRMGRPALSSVLERYRVTRAERISRGLTRPLDRILKLTSEAARKDPQRTRDLVSMLRAQPEVEYADLNLILKATSLPDDPYLHSSGAWGQDFKDLWGVHRIAAPEAWERSTGSGVVVCVLDSGVDLGHEDLAPNVWNNPGELGTDASGRDRRSNGVDDDGNGFADDWRGWDFTGVGLGDNDPTDELGHGTHVAGTIAAVGDNGLGVVGVAPAARIQSVKVLDANGSGTLEDVVAGIVYAADNGARVINASLAGGPFETPRSLIDALAYAHDLKGAVFVAAAGNENREVGGELYGIFPANIRDAVTVAASDHEDRRAEFSNFGPKIDLVAPGGGDRDFTGLVDLPDRSVLSLLSARASAAATGDGRLVVGERYLRQAGTSMAAPHVSGAAALLLSLHPDWSPEQVRQALRSASVDLQAPGFDLDTGYGLLNAADAVTAPIPLGVQLAGPFGRLVAASPVEVRGTAAGPGFDEWSLSYGAGVLPDRWSPIESSNTPVTSGVLTRWDLSTLAEGVHTLRLQAKNAAGRTFEDRLVVTVESVFLDKDAHNSVYRGGDTVVIRGTVGPANFSHYTVEIRGATTGVLPNPRLHLPGDGREPVLDGTLLEWDTTGVPADRYTVVIRVHLSDGTVLERSFVVVVDPSLHPGWPQKIEAAYAYFLLGIWDQPTAADVNRDGTRELFIAYGNQVRLYEHTGAQLAGWPQTVDPTGVGARVAAAPAVGDLDGDGVPEIVCANDQGYLFAWRADGSALPGWPRRLVFWQGYSHKLSVQDLDGDGRGEVILAGEPLLAVFDSQANPLRGWPRNLGVGRLGAPSVADLDGDGLKEIVVSATEARGLFALRVDGTVLPGWPQNLQASAPAVGDLDGDGDLEIVVVSFSDGGVLAFHHDGTVVKGWPQPASPRALAAPVIGDLDGDGRPEVVLGDSFYEVSAWRGDGTRLPGWPVRSPAGSPVLGDVDGDGRADVLLARDDKHSALTAYRHDGTPLGGFPKPTVGRNDSWSGRAALADMDGDGKLEMAWFDFDDSRNVWNLYLWDLEVRATAPMPWPMYRQDAAHRGALADSTPPASLSLIEGRVVDGAGRGISGVGIRLEGGLRARVVTDAEGAFLLDRLPTGRSYAVGALRAGYRFQPDGRLISRLDGPTRIEFLAVREAPSFLLKVIGVQGGNGRVSVDPLGGTCDNLAGPDETCSFAFTAGTKVTLRAAAEPGSRFEGWTGPCSGTGECQFDPGEDEVAHASFRYVGFQPLSLWVHGGRGRVTVDPPGATCDNLDREQEDCVYNYTRDTVVNLTPEPAPGATFVGWRGHCSGSGPCQLTMSNNRIVEAVFDAPVQKLVVTLSGPGAKFAIVQSDRNDLCYADVVPQTCVFSHAQGTSLTLTVQISGNSTFGGWSGACTGAGACTVELSQDEAVTAYFEGPRHLQVVLRGTEGGQGMISADPPGSFCTPDFECHLDYAAGTVVTLEAQSWGLSSFTGWGGACTGQGPRCQVVMTEDQLVYADFLGPRNLQLHLAGIEGGRGSVAVEPSWFYCLGETESTDCVFPFQPGTELVLRAEPSGDSVFLEWEGACSGSTPSCRVKMSDHLAVKAKFLGPRALEIAFSNSDAGGGWVSVEPPGFVCDSTWSGGSCQYLFRQETAVRLRAQAGPDSRFEGWAGACTGTEPVCDVTLADSLAVVARFRGPQALLVHLMGRQAGRGTVFVDPPSAWCFNSGPHESCSYALPPETRVTLTAQPDPGSAFMGWAGACSGRGPCQVTLSESRTVTAVFLGSP